MNQAYWDEAFLTASQQGVGLCVQNVNPKPSAGSRNIFEDDREFILKAAAKHGFRQVDSLKAKVISFIK